MSAWQPDAASLAALTGLLADVQRPDVNQQSMLAQLNAYKGNPGFNNYLAHIFCSDAIQDEAVRSSAALLLKNNIIDCSKQQSASINAPVIKACCLPMFRSNNTALRHAAGTLATAMLAMSALDSWPELVRAIMDALDGGQPELQEGMLSLLYKIAEDFPYQLDISMVAFGSAKPVDLILPKITALFGSDRVEVRLPALRAFNILAQLMPNWLQDNLEGWAAGLIALARDDNDARMQKEVCAGITQLLQLRPDALEPHLNTFLAYILHAMQHTVQEVAIEATEFWIAYMESQLPSEPLLPVLGSLVALLLQFMVYDEYDEDVLAASAAEVAPPKETDADLRPFTSSTAAGAADAGGDDSDAGSDDEASSEWTLRKSCASTLDHLSHEFPDVLLELVLPVVERYLKEDKWRLREAAILALGAVVDGCSSGLAAHMASIVAMLIGKTQDPQPMVRINSCWALGRYTPFIVLRAKSSPESAMQIVQVLEALVGRTKEHNSCVHFAACSALATFFEEIQHSDAGSLVATQAPAVLHQLVALLPSYTRKNVRQALETLVQVYMEPLIARMDASPDTDPELPPLLDTVITLCTPLSTCLEPYAPRLLRRSLSACATCMPIMTHGESDSASASARDAADAASSTLTFALDLIAALSEALGASMEALLGGVGGAEAVGEIATACTAGQGPYLRQSAFAVVGDLATAYPGCLAPHGPLLLQRCLEHLDLVRISEGEMNACNNACWALGLLVLKLDRATTLPLVMPAAERVVAILQQRGMVYQRMAENAAVTLGALATLDPATLAPHANLFLGEWCNQLRSMHDGSEKEAAFTGLVALLNGNPEAGLPCFTSLFCAIASWHAPRPTLLPSLHAVVHGYKGRLTELGQWTAALQRLSDEGDPSAPDKLAQTYGL